ncbi:MAG: pyridoxal-phosphate-dependent aminotransferase [Pseudonocardiales bacterium]|nr:pyridoxal-phosphate-dependent aminotransferase [Pseudonocardiales bacterium]
MAIYLDHAATTPMLPEAIDAVTLAMRRVGNPSSLHAAGRAARRSVEESREALAEAVGARPSEVIFTGGGTEADNLALKGIFWARRDVDPGRRRLIINPLEHHAVLDAVDWLVAHEGAQVTWLEVAGDGSIDPGALAAAIDSDPASVALVSVMWANNEVGTVAPIAELSAVAAERDIPFHTDAVQAIGSLDVSFATSGAAALSLTGHKFGGPYGVGALLLRRDVTCVPLLHGGGQERDVRSGTLDTPGIIGLARAASAAVRRRPDQARFVASLRDRLLTGIQARVPEAVLNGALDQRLPGNLHLSFPGCEGDSLLMLLDAQGVECSTGSACSAGVAQPSHVLLGMGVPAPVARGSLRFSLGHTSTESDVDGVLEVIGAVVERARAAGLASRPGPRFDWNQRRTGVQV